MVFLKDFFLNVNFEKKSADDKKKHEKLPMMQKSILFTAIWECPSLKVPTEIQKYNFMIFHDQQCNFHDYLMHGLQPPLLATSSPH